MERASLFARRSATAAAALVVTLLVFSHAPAASLADDGIIFSFGWNANGMTGLGLNVGNTLVATAIDAANLSGRRIIQASPGVHHSLLLADDGMVFSFGSNEYGQTGLGTDVGDTLVATAIDTTNLGDQKITQVAAGRYHSLLLSEDGTVFSFGRNRLGITGVGTDVGNALVAVPIDTTNLGGNSITAVAAGPYHSLLLDEDGIVYTFGHRGEGELGVGAGIDEVPIATPIDATNLGGRKVTQVAAGLYHSLLLTEDGDVFSLGDNNLGGTGVGTTDDDTPVATLIDATNLAGRTIAQVSVGGGHSLLLANDGTVFSFGRNSEGQLGIDSTSFPTSIAAPIDMTNLAGRTITHVSAGDEYSLLMADDGTVFSFGSNSFGETGLGTSSWYTLVATPIDTTNFGGLRVTGVSAGYAHSLLLAMPVPEPGTATLVMVVGVVLVLRRRRALC